MLAEYAQKTMYSKKYNLLIFWLVQPNKKKISEKYKKGQSTIISG